MSSNHPGPPDDGGLPRPPGSPPPPSGNQPVSQPPPPGDMAPTPPGATPPGTGVGGGTPFSVAEAFSYGWLKFQQHLGPILTGMLVLFLGSAVVGVVWFLITGGLVGALGNSDAALFGALASSAVLGLAFIALAFIIQAGIIRAAFNIVDGRKVELATFLDTDNLGAVIIGSLLVAVATSIGFVLFVLPGLVVAFFTSFFMLFIIDERMAAVDAIRASFDFVNNHIGEVIVLFIAIYVANFIGGLVCGIGVLVSFPVTVIAQAWAFRKLRGQQVTA